MNRPILLVMIVAVLLLAGCGGGPEDKRVNLSGNATFGGKPIVFGSIDFIPDDTRGHSGPAGMAMIIDGKYDTSQGGGGVFPGPHRVRLTGFDSRPPQSTNELEPEPSVQPLFTNYIVALDLKASPVDIDVPESAKGKDFSAPQGPKPRRGSEP